MLVLNVATETRCMYRLPYNYCHHGYHQSWEMLAEGFELNGQMCLAVNVFDEGPHRQLQFWVMKPPGELIGGKDDDKLHWDLRYCFDLGGESFSFKIPGVPGLTTTRCATGMETSCTSMTLEDPHCLPTMVFCCLTRN
jgi:hypothetical protein